MPTVTVTAIQAIQAILAPAVGISAVGLLLLGLLNRYSNVFNRIRLLNDEMRKLRRIIGDMPGGLESSDNIRYANVRKQTEELLLRASLLRNSILSLQVSVGLFVLASIAIGLNLFTTEGTVEIFALAVFLLGMLGVFVGIVFAAREIHRSFKIVLMEVKA
ncbi:MAG TPA: DUF2721 domain-containing protein [Bacteroidota bacterium]|nr:DUF2721 domain-containing protein [Bacteroidota bacterium]